ncbi:MAG: AMP-binding protein, partial [Desulfobacterales bacterium]|nr:AMP-binding protein [Desulfobacterales bacterium]
HAQKRLWFLDKLMPNPEAYNVHGDLLLEGELNVDAVEKALNLIVKRHDTLRTTFPTKDDVPAQVISDHQDLFFPIMDISDREDRDAYVEKIIAEEALTPFDLEKGPLFRVRLLNLSKDKHMMVLTMHHIISDGWSISVLLGESAAAYSAFARSEKPTLPDLRIQYKDFSAWQNRLIQEDALKGQENYWQENLKAPLPVLELPTDNTRPPLQTYVGATHRFSLDPSLSNMIKAFTREKEATLFMVLLSAFGVLLNKLSQKEDIIIGSPIAGRNRPDFEGLIGFFINMISLRMDLSNDPEFTDLLNDVKTTCLNAYANQDYPFDNLIDILSPQRDTSRAPIFNVMFVLQNATENLDDAVVEGVRFRDVTRDAKVAKFDLEFYAFEKEDRIDVQLIFNTDLFKRQTIERFGNYFLNILKHVINAPHDPISCCDIMGEEEKMALVQGFNDTYEDYPLEKCVYRIFEEQVEKTPDHIAVTFEDQSLTYQELNQRANQLARYLRDLGVDREIMVALLLDRSLEMEIALMGVVKAGGAYVPMGTDYPDTRIDYILKDTASPIILTQERHANKLIGKDVRVICLDKEWPDISHEETSNLNILNDPLDLAYVLYTSGSTGVPKGVACIHKGLCNRLVWMQDAYGLNHEDVILQKTPYTFDVSGWEFFWPMMYGARLHFLKPGGHKDPMHIMEIIKERKITTLHFVPSMLGGFLQVVDDDNKDDLTSLKRVICSGEALISDHRDLFFKYLDSELHNLYGPTEASID